jgi:hypothetical protein
MESEHLDDIETKQSSGILIKLILHLQEKKGTDSIKVSEIAERIDALQNASGYNVYRFLDYENGASISDSFENDLHLLASQNDIFLENSEPMVSITPIGILDARSITIPEALTKELDVFLKKTIEV